MVIAIDARPMLTEPRTGVGEYTYELLSHLFAMDTPHRYILFANRFATAGHLPFQEYPHVTWVMTHIPNKLFHASIYLFRRPRLDRYVARRAGVDHVDVWFSPNLLFTAVSKQVRHILTVHDLSFFHYPSLFSRKGRLWHSAVRARRQIERADLVLTPSIHTKRDLEARYGATSVQTVSPGLCSHIESPDRKSTEYVQHTYQLPETFFLYLGTLEPRKNIEGMVEAYRSSAYLQKHTSLIFAGALGYEGERYRDMIAHTSGARYIGYVAEDEKHALYTLARAFIYPSLYEGFGLPVLEARASGTPVITSHRSSLPEVVDSTARLVSVYNISALAGAMEDALEDTDRSQERQRAEQPFSWTQSATQLLHLLTDL